MFRSTFQNKLFSLLTSFGSDPLNGWIVKKNGGWVRQVKDADIGAWVLELRGPNVATTHVTSPPPPHCCLGLGLPCVNLIVKYLDQPFSFEVQIVDDDGMRRRLRFSSYHGRQRGVRVSTFESVGSLPLAPGWNVVQLDLAQFTQRAYRTMYMETSRVQVHANCRLRRIFFSDRLYKQEELPKDYQISIGRPTSALPVLPDADPDRDPSMNNGANNASASEQEIRRVGPKTA